MQISKDWKIGADNLNVILYKRKGKEPKPYWVAHGYFGTVKAALNELVDQDIRDTDLTDLRTVEKTINELKADIAKLGN